MKSVITLLLFLVIGSVQAQKNFGASSDTLSKKRLLGVSTGILGVWVGSTISLSNTWYKPYQAQKFHLFDDCGDWLQMDKAGHFYTTHKFSMASSDLLRWSGVEKNQSILFGTAIGLGYQTTIELLDGRSSGWGFSWCDIGANTLGATSFAAQELVWNEQRFIFKFSYHPTRYASYRPHVLGESSLERILKDYNGQTYWMSFSPATFLDLPRIPKWVCFSLGYSVDQKLVGNKEYYYSETDGTSFNSKRVFLLSLDIDFSKLPIRAPWLKAVVKQFHYLKIPFPTLQLSSKQLSGHGLYF